MEQPYLDLPTLGSLLLAGLPLPYFVAALLALRRREHTAWQGSFGGAVVALCGALVAVVLAAASGHGDQRLCATVTLLIAFVAVIIVRFSRTYLAGEADQSGYVFALMTTLGSVAIVATTNNLLVLAVAWTGASLALHRLLTFYSARRAALIAAHKKFIASRVADACLFTAVLLFAYTLGTVQIDDLLQRAATTDQLPVGARVAVVLVAVTALLRCAQLPFHGWLIQVMEAPTPVSALLHAGVVNLGGFVLIRLGPLVADVAAAQVLLVVVGAVTAAIAALVAMTRVSIKVALAWSTCAQMGFMLMQSGLGAYDLALLHLLAHSLYKAHAFLSSGSVVEQSRLRLLSPCAASRSPHRAALAAVAAFAVVGLAAAWLAAAGYPVAWAPTVVVCLAVAQWLALPTPQSHRVRSAAVGGAIVAGWLALHALLGIWIEAPTVPAPMAAVVVGTMLWFVALYVVQSAIAAWPRGALARSLYPWFYAGLYLDELMTRATFRIWPIRTDVVVAGRRSSAMGGTT